MGIQMIWHEEVLDRDAKRAASRLAGAAGVSFYLAGGTGLALRLGHRISLDLDLFSPDDRLGPARREALLESLMTTGPVEVLESKDGTCHLLLGKTRASLFHYRYSLLESCSDWKGLRVASLKDIAAMKVGAIVGRGARKDFIDAHAICLRIGLGKVLSACEERFPEHRDFMVSAARALVYFADAEKEPMPRLLREVSWDGVKAYFEREVPKALGRRIRSRKGA